MANVKPVSNSAPRSTPSTTRSQGATANAKPVATSHANAPKAPAAPNKPTTDKANAVNAADRPSTTNATSATKGSQGTNATGANGKVDPSRSPAADKAAASQKPTSTQKEDPGQLIKQAQEHLKLSQQEAAQSKIDLAKSKELAASSEKHQLRAQQERKDTATDLNDALSMMKKGDFSGALKELNSANTNFGESLTAAKQSKLDAAESKKLGLKGKAEAMASELHRKLAEEELKRAHELLKQQPPSVTASPTSSPFSNGFADMFRSTPAPTAQA